MGIKAIGNDSITEASYYAELATTNRRHWGRCESRMPGKCVL